MRLPTICMLLLAAAMCAGAPEKPRVSRSALVSMERACDQSIQRFDINDPLDFLGSTRGVYLQGYGAVFTTEINLVFGTRITPFRPAFSKEEIERLHQKKLQRLPLLKRKMREMLRDLAVSLDTVPAKEQIVLGVSLFHFSWENSSDLPTQILMSSERQALLDFNAKRLSEAALDAAIRVQEF